MRFFVFAFFICLTVSLRAEDQNGAMQVYVVQNKTETNADSGVVKIKKEPFQLKFIFPGNPEVFVHASRDREVYDAALSGIRQEYLFPFFSGWSMAEEYQNKNKFLFLENQSNSYWYYDTETKNRFDGVKKENGGYVCTRSIENIYELKIEKMVPVSEYQGEAIYLTILHCGKKEETVKINFKPLLDNPDNPFHSFAQWAFDNRYIDRSTFDVSFNTEVKRICVKIEFTE